MAIWFLLLVSVYTCSAATRLFRIQGLEGTPVQYGKDPLLVPGSFSVTIDDFIFFNQKVDSVQVSKAVLLLYY